MTPIVRRAIACLIAFLMPFQVLTAVYLDVRGPAHFHAAGDGARHGLSDNTAALPEHEHGRAHEYSHVVEAMGLKARGRHVHSHTHGGPAVERHHHQPGDSSVVTIDDHGLPVDFAVKEETTGWSGAMLVTLPASGPSMQFPAGLSAPLPQPEHFLKSRTPGRLERPPRLISI